MGVASIEPESMDYKASSLPQTYRRPVLRIFVRFWGATPCRGLGLTSDSELKDHSEYHSSHWKETILGH